MASVEDLIRSRRTHKRFDGSPVARETLLELAGHIRWAPNHKLTEPWKAYLLDQPAIRRLCEFLRSELVHAPDLEAKVLDKAHKLADQRLPTLGGLIQVTCRHSEDRLRFLEDHAACSAGVQNLLLAAEARGLASFWSSSAPLRHDKVLRWFGGSPREEQFIASIWLGGRSTDPKPPPRRDATHYCHWI